VGVEQIEVVEIEIAAAGRDEHGRQPRVFAQHRDHVPGDVVGAVGEQVHDDVAVVAGGRQGELVGQRREDPDRVAPPLALEGQDVRGRQLAPAAARRLVEARVEEAKHDLLARDHQLLGRGQRQPAREGRPIAAHAGRRVDQQQVLALRLFLGLVAGVVEHLVVGHAPGELVRVPGQLGQHQPVEAAPAPHASVAEGRVLRRPRAGLGLEHARDELEREAHHVAGARVADRREEVDLHQRRRRRRGVAEHPDEAERIDVERVGERQHEQLGPGQRRERVELEAALRHPRPERRQIQIRQLERPRLGRQPDRVGPLHLRALRHAPQHPRQQHREHPVGHAQILGPARGVAVGDALDHLAVRRHQLRGARHPRHERREIAARAQRQLLPRRREEHPDVMDEREGQRHTHPVEVSLPRPGPQRERRGARRDQRHGQRAQRASDGGVRAQRRGNRHEGRVARLHRSPPPHPLRGRDRLLQGGEPPGHGARGVLPGRASVEPR
jgi:hypothetical protein